VKIAILGAGVTGLALARFLIEGGLAAESIHLFERSSVPGGLCRSKTAGGFTYDVAGGHILYSKDRPAMSWMMEHAGGEAAFARRDRHTRIRWEDRWVRYPFENGLGDLPAQANFECIRGYVQAWHARQTNGSAAPADFKSWIRWRFGDGIAEHFMDPYNEKIWKRDLAEITSDWVAGRVPDAPVDDVLRASVGIPTEGYTHQAIFYYPLHGGFQALTDGLAAPLMPRIRLSTPVREIERTRAGARVNGEEFDLVVSTLPLNALPGIVRNVPAPIAAAMRGLAYNGLVSLLIALDRPEHPDLSWVYLPQRAQGPANRVTYMSNYSPGNAPAGKTSLLAEVTWPGGERFPDSSLDREVIEGLVHAGLVEEREILFTDRSEVEQAYVVYDAGHVARRKAAIDWLEEVGILPIGRFGRYDYDNSDQCVIKARELARTLLSRIAVGR
jgi:protoporphyrinogen oxidase